MTYNIVIFGEKNWEIQTATIATGPKKIIDIFSKTRAFYLSNDV